MNGVRLCVVAEGQTEESFVNRVLAEHLGNHGVFVSVHCVTTSRDRRANRVYRGGLLKYVHLRKDLTRWMKQEQKNDDCWFTTMVDLYRFPTADSPFDDTIRSMPDPYKRVEALQDAIRQDVGLERRFVPYVQLHEFEALVLSDASRFGAFFDNEKAIRDLQDLVAGYDSPELIDDGETTAPSKRIISAIPEYECEKTVAGAEIASDIGVSVLRQCCPHFGKWLTALETLPSSR